MIKSSDDIERKVLEKVTPPEKYRRKLEKVIQDLTKSLENEIKKKRLPASIELVGSTAKDTYIKDNLDIDLFLMFPTTISKEIIAENALSLGKKLLKDTEECFAEHPYIRGYFKNNKVEIVPCYKIERASQKLSAVDRTPLHTKYIKEYLHESQKPEVRLFKQFLKGIGCYGAEAEVEGFSGYLCEILILRYKSFKKIIDHAQHWKIGEKISLTNRDFPAFDTPLTFIDPVDEDRNVASALSEVKFNLFVRACKEFLIKPDITFFFPNEIKPWTLEKIESEIKKQDKLYVGVEIEKPDIIDENLYPQIRKAVRSIWNACKRCDFTIYDIAFHIDNIDDVIVIIVKLKKEVLSKIMVHMGPPIKLKKNVKEFMSKWKDNPRVIKPSYEKNGRYYVEIKREYREIGEFLEDQVEKLSLGKHLDISKEKKYKIIDLKTLLRENLRVFWTKYLDEKYPWER